MENALLQAALKALKSGLRPIPVGPDKKPYIHWKQYQFRIPTESEIGIWWEKWPDANVAILTGEASGVDVIDFDPEHDEWPPKEYELPNDCIVRTPRGGLHYYIKHIQGLRNSASKIGKHIDVRADGGYVLIPPSIGGNGNSYEYLNGYIAEAREAEDWMVTELCRKIDSEISTSITPDMEPIPSGKRNSTLASIAGSMRRRGLSEQELIPSLIEINKNRCAPPLDESEVRGIARSISNYLPADDAFLGQDGHEKIYPLNDIGNGQRLVDRHGMDLLYSHDLRKWLIWDGIRWNPNFSEIYRRAKETVFSIKIQAEQCKDEETKNQLRKHYKYSSKGSNLREMIIQAQSEPGIEISQDELDSDGMILNVLNGTIDLRSGVLRPHNRADLITKICNVEFHADAKCPEWEKFLNKVMGGNTNLIKFLQRAVGYSLTSNTGERVIFILFGPGANGKSTFIQIILNLSGEYGCRTPTSTLMVKFGNTIPNDIARLKGMRFVSCAESEFGQKLAEALIKDMTGNERIAARFMRAEWFEFLPTYKIWLSTNNKPEIRGGDDAIWSRIRLIPFKVIIPPEEQDHNLQNKLMDELPGILRWAVEGCIEWQKIGLNPPKEVIEATKDYKDEMDIISNFFSERIEQNVNYQISKKILYEAFEEWCKENGNHAMSKKEFGIRLSKKGISDAKSGDTRYWIGINLRKE